jgi:hypothetical protein
MCGMHSVPDRANRAASRLCCKQTVLQADCVAINVPLAMRCEGGVRVWRVDRSRERIGWVSVRVCTFLTE